MSNQKIMHNEFHVVDSNYIKSIHRYQYLELTPHHAKAILDYYGIESFYHPQDFALKRTNQLMRGFRHLSREAKLIPNPWRFRVHVASTESMTSMIFTRLDGPHGTTKSDHSVPSNIISFETKPYPFDG